MSPTGLAELYATHAPRARGLAFLLTGDAAPSEDLVQDCFVRLAAGSSRSRTRGRTCAGWS